MMIRKNQESELYVRRISSAPYSRKRVWMGFSDSRVGERFRPNHILKFISPFLWRFLYGASQKLGNVAKFGMISWECRMISCECKLPL